MAFPHRLAEAGVLTSVLAAIAEAITVEHKSLDAFR
ncbi:hypothetical protein X727_32475 [Mesorhizobium sp. L103C119B0]|nr:hypothetical protein X727_32475 [Mesorhizobium sp. L103C119B0]